VERVERRLGRRARGQAAVAGGYTTALRGVVTLDDGEQVFVKAGGDEMTSSALRAEWRIYAAIEASFLPRCLAFEDGDVPLLVLESLAHAHWPPPWRVPDVERLRAALAAVASTSPPEGVPPLTAEGPLLRGWPRVQADPEPFLSLGLAGRSWLERALPMLREQAERARLAGTALLHFDVRSDNVCFVGDRAVLVDWNWAVRGNPRFDMAFWMPTLSYETGTAPEALCPDAPTESALVAGYFAAQAGLPSPTPSMVRVRALQRRQLEVALPWAARANGLPHPR
jgi:hypothetical protein